MGSLDLSYFEKSAKVATSRLAKLDGTDHVTKVEDAVATPANVALCQNYPNSFIPTTLIEYSGSRQSYVTLKYLIY